MGLISHSHSIYNTSITYYGAWQCLTAKRGSKRAVGIVVVVVVGVSKTLVDSSLE